MDIERMISYPLDRGIEVIGISRTLAYKAIASGELVTFKCGRRRMVTRRALENYIESKESAAATRSEPTDRERPSLPERHRNPTPRPRSRDAGTARR